MPIPTPAPRLLDIDVAESRPDVVARMRALLAVLEARETPEGEPRTADPAWIAAMEALGYAGDDD